MGCAQQPVHTADSRPPLCPQADPCPCVAGLCSLGQQVGRGLGAPWPCVSEPGSTGLQDVHVLCRSQSWTWDALQRPGQKVCPGQSAGLPALQGPPCALLPRPAHSLPSLPRSSARGCQEGLGQHEAAEDDPRPAAEGRHGQPRPGARQAPVSAQGPLSAGGSSTQNKKAHSTRVRGTGDGDAESGPESGGRAQFWPQAWQTHLSFLPL